MTLRTLWDNYFRLPQFLVNGVALPVRQVVNLIGGSAVDNPTEERTDITLPTGGGATPDGSTGQYQRNNGLGGFEADNALYSSDTGIPVAGYGLGIDSGTGRSTIGSAATAARSVQLPDASGQVVLTSAPQSLEEKVLVEPIVEGSSTFQLSVTAGHRVFATLAEQQSDAAATTTLYQFAMSDETLCAFDVIVTCARRTNVTKGGRYKRSVAYRRTGGGAPTIVGSLENGTDQETTSGDNVTIDVSGNNVRVRITAADSDSRNWFGEIRIQETVAA